MPNLSELVKKIGCALDSVKGSNTDLLQTGAGNLNGAEVVFDEDIPFYSAIIPGDGRYIYMDKRRITAFRNPNLILILRTKNWFGVNTEAELLTPKNYTAKHQEFLEEITKYGFVHKDGMRVSVLQNIVDKEESIFERVMANYQPLMHLTK